MGPMHNSKQRDRKLVTGCHKRLIMIRMQQHMIQMQGQRRNGQSITTQKTIHTGTITTHINRNTKIPMLVSTTRQPIRRTMATVNVYNSIKIFLAMRGALMNVVLFMKHCFYIQYIFVMSLKERGKYPAIYMYLSMTEVL